MQAVREGGGTEERGTPPGRRDQRSAKNAEKWVLTNGSGCAKMFELPRKRRLRLDRIRRGRKERMRAWKSSKKVLDKAAEMWYNRKAANQKLEIEPVEKVWKDLKKVLDKRIRVWYNLKAAEKRRSWLRALLKGFRKSWKTSKKVLDKRLKLW